MWAGMPVDHQLERLGAAGVEVSAVGIRSDGGLHRLDVEANPHPDFA